jgi:hypothetical protein
MDKIWIQNPSDFFSTKKRIFSNTPTIQFQQLSLNRINKGRPEQKLNKNTEI